MKTCSVAGCAGKVHAKGYCKKHYRRWKKYGDPLHVEQVRDHDPFCSVEGCDGKHYSRGWCKKHYDRWQKHGNPLDHGGCIVGDDEARFDSKVNKNGPVPTHPGTPDTKCWIWTGDLCAAGYGRININSKTVRAHRYAYTRAVGPIPIDKPHVLHKCDTPACVNSEHLYPGTPKQNVDDSIERNRKPKGDAHANAKLSWLQVLDIRSDPRTQRSIAKHYGITPQNVGYIKRRQSWEHLSEEGDWTFPAGNLYPETFTEADLEFEC